MTKGKRNIGQEILEGIRELKRGEHGRVTNLPAVSSVRRRTGLSQARFARLLGVSGAYAPRVGTRAPRAIRGSSNPLVDRSKDPRALLEVA
jgi:putative transcriptional regulator